ncbi:MAG: LytR/AlgR family response regulator transcription factor [Bacteroidia bacterium]
MLTSIIIDDEKASRTVLRNYLEQYCSDVSILGEAANIQDGKKAIDSLNPDLVFLDVEMPFGNAFDLLEQYEELSFEVIFVTAFDHYAIKALNLSAAYYLLKPVDIEELVGAVEKVKAQLATAETPRLAQLLTENLRQGGGSPQRMALPLLDGFEVINIDDIVYGKADGNFTDLFMKDGSKKMVCRPLRFFEENLVAHGFLRIHKSSMVNLACITRYKRGKGGQLFLQNGTVLDVSSGRKADLLKRFPL